MDEFGAHEYELMNRAMTYTEINYAPSKCRLCGRVHPVFTQSHSVPEFILRKIRENGYLIRSTVPMNIKGAKKDSVSARNAGTFEIICQDCDSRCFQVYEQEDNLLKPPTDQLMAQIALKDSLHQLYKSTIEKGVNEYLLKNETANPQISARISVVDGDIRLFEQETDYYDGLLKSDCTGSFQVLFWKVLPYQVPIAAQSHIPLRSDMEGKIINDNHKRSSERTQSMHLCIFPLKQKSVVLAFYHKRDRKYRGLWHRFNSTSDDSCLAFLNYILFLAVYYI